jgi:signal transduction histidine kinase
VRCDPNPLVVSPHPALADLAHLGGSAVLLLTLLTAARRAESRLLVVTALALVTVPLTVAGEPAGPLLAAGVAAAALTFDLLRATTRSARLAGAVTALTTAADPEAVLADSLGVTSVSLGYPVAGGVLVDQAGQRLPPPSPGEAVVNIVGPEGLVAQLRGNLNAVAPVALAQALRGPARLALENNRLAAEAIVRTEEVRSSAARLVVLAEQGRRNLERDLHDGAQRHVLTLGLAIQSAPELPDPVRREAASTVRTVLDQLRDVAHGIRPPQLDTGGLAHAWAVLADRSPVPVEVGPVPEDIDPTSAGAAYRLLEDTVRTATAAVTASFRPTDDGWRLVVTAAAAGELTTRIGDQFVALGGSLRSRRVGLGWHHEGRLPPTLR